MISWGIILPKYIGDCNNPRTGNPYKHYKPTRIQWNKRGILNTAQLGVSMNGGTPSHHPFLEGIFDEINIINHPAIKGYPHDHGNLQWYLSISWEFHHTDYWLIFFRGWNQQMSLSEGIRSNRGFADMFNSRDLWSWGEQSYDNWRLFLNLQRETGMSSTR